MKARLDLSALILAVTIAALIALVDHRPRPVKDNQVAYCVIDEYQASKGPMGMYLFHWGKAFGPCSLQDIYREI